MTQARKRLVDQEALLRQSNETLEYAKKANLPALVKESMSRCTRNSKAVAATRELVKDLEKASGALPLK